MDEAAKFAPGAGPVLQRAAEQDDLGIAPVLGGDRCSQRHPIAPPVLEVARNLLEADVDPDERARLFTPLGRAGHAMDIAQGVLYLASDASCYVTGTELVVDGGRLGL